MLFYVYIVCSFVTFSERGSKIERLFTVRILPRWGEKGP